MQFHVHRDTRRIIYYTLAEETFLQSLEGLTERIVSFQPLPNNITKQNCFQYKLEQNAAVLDVAMVYGADILLLNRKAQILHQVERLATSVRYPYTKNLSGQNDVYALKYNEAVAFLIDQTKEYPFLKDEAEIEKISIETAARQIIRQRQERDFIYQCSERARRIFIKQVCQTSSEVKLTEIEKQLTKRNFRLPFEIK